MICYLILFTIFVGKVFADDVFSVPKPIELLSGKSIEELLAIEAKGEISIRLYYTIAVSYKEKGNPAQAKYYFLKAISLEPQNSFLYGELGKIYLLSGQKDSAIFYFERSLELNYENIPIWEEIIKLRPEYYFNLGKLYEEKGRERRSVELLHNAIQYLNKYESDVPAGQFVELSRTSRKEIELIIKDIETKKRREEQKAREEERARAKAEALRSSMIAFRNLCPYYVGVGFSSFQPSFSFTFYAKDPASVVDDSITLKQPISQLTIYGGMFKGPFFARTFLGFGSAGVDKSFHEGWNMNLTPPKPIYGSLSELKIFRIGAELYYNPFFKPPILMFVGVEGDYARYTPVDRKETFKSISGAQAGGGLIIMGYSKNFVFEIGYIQGVVGAKRGGRMNGALGYKFNL